MQLSFGPLQDMTQSFAQLQTWREILHISQCDTWISIARLRPRNQWMRKGHWEEQRVNALISWLQQHGGLLLGLNVKEPLTISFCICIQDLIQKKYCDTWNLQANWAAVSFASENDYCRPYIIYLILHVHCFRSYSSCVVYVTCWFIISDLQGGKGSKESRAYRSRTQSFYTSLWSQ